MVIEPPPVVGLVTVLDKDEGITMVVSFELRLSNSTVPVLEIPDKL